MGGCAVAAEIREPAEFDVNARLHPFADAGRRERHSEILFRRIEFAREQPGHAARVVPPALFARHQRSRFLTKTGHAEIESSLRLGGLAIA